MAFKKIEHYPELYIRVSLACLMLSHPARLKIIAQLMKQGPSHVKALSVEHPLAPATVSQHLEHLRVDRMVDAECMYPWIKYSINRDTLRQVREDINRFFDILEEDIEEG